MIFTSRKLDKFQFIAGAYYYHNDGFYDPLGLHGIAFGGLLYGFMEQESEAVSGFAELTYQPTDRLTLIGGARYSREERTAWGTYSPTPISTSSLPRLGSPVTYDDVTPRASVRYSVTDDDDNVYFTYSQGFKSGGFNISALNHAILPF